MALHELEEERAVGDDPVAALQSAGHVVILVVAIAERHVPPRKAAVLKSDIDEGQILVVAKHRGDRDEQPSADSPGLDRTSTYICFLRRSPGLGATIRATTARVLGSTEGETFWTVPRNGPVPLPGSICAASPSPIEARSVGEICAMTQTFERLATVNAGVEPACSNWPGVICLSATIPATGARIIPTAPASGFRPVPRDRSPVDAHRHQGLKRSIPIRFGARCIGLGLLGLARGNAVVRGEVLVRVGELSRV